MNTAMSIGWMSWLSQNVGDEAEAAGGLKGRGDPGRDPGRGALGGTLLDHFGIGWTFAGSVVLSAIAIAVIGSDRKMLSPPLLHDA